MTGTSPGCPSTVPRKSTSGAKAGQNHGAGSTNIARVILARRIGISRTPERPYPDCRYGYTASGLEGLKVGARSKSTGFKGLAPAAGMGYYGAG